MDITNLKHQLELYTRGDFDALENILAMSSHTGTVYGNGAITVNDNHPQPQPQPQPKQAKQQMQSKQYFQTGQSFINNNLNNNLNRNLNNIDLTSTLDDTQSTILSPQNNINQSNQTQTNQPNQPNQPNQTQTNQTQNTSILNLTEEKKREIAQNTKEWIRLDEALTKLKQLMLDLTKQKNVIGKSIIKDIETYDLKDIKKGNHQLIPKIKQGRKKAFSQKGLKEKLIDYFNTVDAVENPQELIEQAMSYINNTIPKSADTVLLEHKKL